VLLVSFCHGRRSDSDQVRPTIAASRAVRGRRGRLAGGAHSGDPDGAFSIFDGRHGAYTTPVLAMRAAAPMTDPTDLSTADGVRCSSSSIADTTSSLVSGDAESRRARAPAQFHTAARKPRRQGCRPAN
jgi:hypothetical protein